MVIARTRWSVSATLVVAGVVGAGCGYNTIQTLDEQVNAAASQIKVQLQRRAGPVPDPVETGKGGAQQEQTGFIAGAAARAKLARGGQSGAPHRLAARHSP